MIYYFIGIFLLVAVIIRYHCVVVQLLNELKNTNNLLIDIQEERDNCQEERDYYQEEFNRSLITIRDLYEEVFLLNLQHIIHLMLAYQLENDVEKYTYCFNQLYFFGIEEAILKDTDLLKSFLQLLQEKRIFIKEGTKPFKFQFLIKEGEENEKEI